MNREGKIMGETKKVVLGKKLTIEEFMSVVRDHAEVEFSEEYRKRVEESRKVVEQCVEEGRVVYGTTTGFGALVTETIGKEDAEKLQKNIIITHSTSVGAPFGEEEVRAIILMVLQSLGMGVSGVRIQLLERYRDFLNKNLIPYTPKEGSVGYLCAEGHIAATLIGEGKAYYNGKLYDSKTALSLADIEPFSLSYKEGLALLNGTSSPTALAVVGIYDLMKGIRSADVIAAMSFEMLGGLLRAYDDRVLSLRPQQKTLETANIIKRLLKGSQVVKSAECTHVQDPLSIRCIPQCHGAVKKTLQDAWDAIEIEINGCADNPVVYGNAEDPQVFSNGNPDASYVGIEMDSACVAATAAAKMSERRNVRFLDEKLSQYPYFLIGKPGLNSGLMIPQYTQAGLLNDMKILSTPASIDSVTTSANQEDYVSMGYNATKKALQISEKFEYILAIELLSAYQAQQFVDASIERGEGTAAVIEALKEIVPIMKEDFYLYPCIEKLREWIHKGELLNCVTKWID